MVLTRVRSFALSAGRLATNDAIDAEMIAWLAETFSDAPFIGAAFGFGQLSVAGVTIYLQNGVVAYRFEDSRGLDRTRKVPSA